MVANTPPPFLGIYQLGAIPPDEVHTFDDGVDLTGFTVTFEWWPNADPASPTTVAGSIVDGPAGKASWPWSTVLDDVAGRYTGRLVVTNGTTTTLVGGPFVWEVDDPTGAGLP